MVLIRKQDTGMYYRWLAFSTVTEGCTLGCQCKYKNAENIRLIDAKVKKMKE